MSRLKTYSELNEDAASIRKSVFMEEQGFVNEFDDVDGAAKHIVLYNDENAAVATCRCFPSEDNKAYIIGRIAVLKEYRRNRYGSLVLREAERLAMVEGVKEVRLAAQAKAVEFYRKQGYSVIGEEFSEENCPHFMMYKKLTEN